MIEERILPDRSQEWRDAEAPRRAVHPARLNMLAEIEKCIDCNSAMKQTRNFSRLRCTECARLMKIKRTRIRNRQLLAKRHGVSLGWLMEKLKRKAAPVPPNLAADLIIHECAKKYGVTLADFVNPHKRPRSIAAARREACSRMRDELKLSYPQIAKQIGFTNYTSVMLAERRYRAEFSATA